MKVAVDTGNGEAKSKCIMSSRQKRKGPSAGETEGSQTDDLQTWALEPNHQYGDLMLGPPGSSTTDQPCPHGAASALLNIWG